MPTSGVINGTDLGLYINGLPHAFATSHSINIECEVRDVSSKKSGKWKAFKAGVLSWSVSGSGLTVYDIDKNTKASSASILAAMIAQQEVTIKHTTAELGNRSFSGQVIIKSFTAEAPDDANSTYSFTMQGTGELEILESVFYANSLFANTVLNAGTQLFYNKVIN